MAAQTQGDNMAARIYRMYRDHIVTALLIAIFVSVPSISVQIDRALGATADNTIAIEEAKKELAEQVKRLEAIDTKQSENQVKTQKDIAIIKNDIRYIKDAIDALKKGGN